MGGIGDDEVEWRVSGSDYRDGSFRDDLGVAVPVGQHIPFSERLQVLLDRHPGLCCLGLEIQEKNKTGLGSPIEYAKLFSWLFQRAGAGFGVLMLKDGDKRIDVQFLEGRCGFVSLQTVRNKEILPELFIVLKPDVCFDADAARLKGLVKRHLAPIVVMRMTRHWFNITTKVLKSRRRDLAGGVLGSPVFDYIMEPIARYFRGQAVN